jgi:hypothetical protein
VLGTAAFAFRRGWEAFPVEPLGDRFAAEKLGGSRKDKLDPDEAVDRAAGRSRRILAERQLISTAFWAVLGNRRDLPAVLP